MGWPLMLALAVGSIHPRPARAANRVGLAVISEDSFSQRPAELLEYLGSARLQREPDTELVAGEDLLSEGANSDVEARFLEAIEKVTAGVKGYDNLEPQVALRELGAALRTFEQMPVRLSEQLGPYYKALTYLGASHVAKGDKQAGQAAFRRLLVIERRAKLDSRLFPPDMVRMFESARKEVSTEAGGMLSVYSSPENAKVFVDGNFRGVTPCEVAGLPFGKHIVRLSKAGYEPWGRVVKVVRDAENAVTCRLVELAGKQSFFLDLSMAAASIEEGKPLTDALRARMQEQLIDRLLIGRLSQRGEGLKIGLALYEVSSGKNLRYYVSAVSREQKEFSQAAEALFSYLLTGRRDVLQSLPDLTAADVDPIKFRDEDQFAREEEKPEWYETWWFWTAVGAGVVAVVATGVALGLTLQGESPPGAQILLEFDVD
ncbi:MAG: PEGA domain-containing protein [Deltaproteobacteria bacterium]|nr:PEGA domain-containing protein [Deltaproteobacteria bacterium]